MLESVDQLHAIKELQALRPLLANKKLKNSVRLLCVFGYNGCEVIFATKEDTVYGYGPNLLGRLGVGVDGPVTEPTINRTLSGKGLVDVVYGFGHCIGLTRSGQCYGMGENTYGQLGNGSYESTSTPQLIREFADKEVLTVVCGYSHTLALTTDGQVYGFGRNNLGQLGDKSYSSRANPTAIHFYNDMIVSISCGKNHSLGLSDTGQVYVWGLNACGQLGRHPDRDKRVGRELPVCYRPEVVEGLGDVQILKAICGTDHTLLLSTDGHIYAFGGNDFGQIGNGSRTTQYTPVRITKDIRFRDIITHFDISLSLGVSVSGKCYVWGLAVDGRYTFTPQPITDSMTKLSIHDIYANYSRINKSFKTIVFENKNVLKANNTSIAVTNHIENNLNIRKSELESMAKKVIADFDPNLKQTNGTDSFRVPKTLPVFSRDIKSKPTVSDNHSLDDTIDNVELIPLKVFLRHLSKAFDNQSNHDLVFVFPTNDRIYCHKSILKIRNKKLWNICDKYLFQNKSPNNEIVINGYSYEAFKVFVQFLYGMKPEINSDNRSDVLLLATCYREPILLEMCGQGLSDKVVIDLSNFCSLYEKAVNESSLDLEKSCVEFAKLNFRDICQSDAFHAMPEYLSKRLIQSHYT